MQKENKEGLLNIDSTLYQTRLSRKFENRTKYVPFDPRQVISYIPGVVIDILVTPGAKVKIGQDLMIIDAMKMKNRIKASIDGTVKSVAVVAGAKVTKGSILIELELN